MLATSCLKVLTDKSGTHPVYKTWIEGSNSLPILGCHRGGCGDFGPENTMYSFRKSVFEFSAQLLEIDLNLTKDNHVIILHDTSIANTTNGQGMCYDYDLKDIQMFDAAYNYGELAGQGVNIPSLREFLDEFVPVPGLTFMLDFKGQRPVQPTLDLVEEYGIWDRVILGSVVGDTNTLLRTLRKHSVPVTSDAATTTSMTIGHFSGLLSFCTISHDIFGYMLFPTSSNFWKKSLVDAMHKLGLPVLLCGADTEEEQIQCIEWGVDIILTNDPGVLRNTLDKYQK